MTTGIASDATDVLEWLIEAGLGQYAYPIIRDGQADDMFKLMELTDSDLASLGLTAGDIVKFFDALGEEEGVDEVIDQQMKSFQRLMRASDEELLKRIAVRVATRLRHAEAATFEVGGELFDDYGDAVREAEFTYAERGRPIDVVAIRDDGADEVVYTSGPFPVLCVSGSYRDIGYAVGSTFRTQIRTALEQLPLFQTTIAAATGPQRQLVATLHAAVEERFPHLLEELLGMAEGTAIPMEHLFAWNCRSELAAAPSTPGCSSIGFVADGSMGLAHNEDGDEPHLGKMFVVRAKAPSGISFATLVYPGTLPGSGPGFNDRGVVQTTNFIASDSTEPGVPRYFLGRGILEASSLEHAVAIATTTPRAFPWHHNLASLTDARLVSLETWPGRQSRIDVNGTHIHTNHLVHPTMKDLPGDAQYLSESSGPRFEALTRAISSKPPRNRVDLVTALRDHSGTSCRVCRHPGDPVSGVTVAMALFSFPRRSMTLLKGPPCTGSAQVVET